MERRVDDVLDFSKIEADQLVLGNVEFEPRRLADDVFQLWQPRARSAGLALRLEASLELPARVRGDALRVRQVLDNFVGNALKFTERGSIELRVAPVDHGPFAAGMPVRLRFAVTDTGIGIAPGDSERVFDAFTQVDDSWSGRAGRPVPIIALTANAFQEDRDRAREAGMDDFLARPVRPDGRAGGVPSPAGRRMLRGGPGEA